LSPPRTSPRGGAAASVSMRRVLLGLFGLACAGAGGLVAWNRLSGPAVGDESAVLGLFLERSWEDAEGRSLDTGTLKGQVLLINFWATWCPPCVEEMPELDQLHREWAGKGVQVLGIGIDSRAKILDFSRRAQYAYPLLVGGADASELSRAFGNASAALPFTVLIGRDGRVRERILGRFHLPRLQQAVRSAAA